MELIRGLNGLNGRHRGSAVTIGTFDGMHVGHQALLARLREHGSRLARPVMVLTFEPMPREFLLGEDRVGELVEVGPTATVFADPQGRIVTLKVGELHQDEATFILARLTDLAAGRIALAAARNALPVSSPRCRDLDDGRFA